MPPSLTYPGVYVQEISSGVHAITGVSTSVTAFIGQAAIGPINRAVRVLSFADYERKFGGLTPDSEMSYAVRQFFANGGTEAQVVRVSKGAVTANRDLTYDSVNHTLQLTAIDAGAGGNSIFIDVDYATTNPASTFNLTVTYWPPGALGPVRSEFFPNVSMNSKDRRYVETIVKNESTLVQARRSTASATLSGLGNGTSEGGDIVDSGGNVLDVATLIDSRHNELRIQAGDNPAVKVVLLPTDLTLPNAANTAAAHLSNLCGAIQAKAFAASGTLPAYGGTFCAVGAGGNNIVFTCGTTGETSVVRVLPGVRNDATSVLRLGEGGGGIETDAVASVRPVRTPGAATLRSGAIAALTSLPDATHHRFLISLDGYPAVPVDLAPIAVTGSLTQKLTQMAAAIQTAVRALKSNAAYRKFECVADGAAKQLLLSTGTRGAEGSILVAADPTEDLAASLKLLAGAVATAAPDVTLQGGNDGVFDPADYGTFIGDQALRTGIFALEAVDLFNLLVLPGVTDPGVLQDAAAYCAERRAFLLIDSPIKGATDTDPVSAMETKITGNSLPKVKDGAVYFPWIRIADPLAGGNLRLVAPTGTIAGLLARTDSTRGVWKAPAGTEATLVGVQEVAYRLTDGENGVLNPHGVNCLRIFPVYGAICWGARTLRGDDQMADEWKYIPVRRTALYIEESLFRGLKWVVFEPNDEPLWAQIRLNVGAFMHTMFRQGAFQGSSPKDAYYVRCDGETTTQDDINHGIVNIEVGFAPLKPAEFVVIKLSQIAGQIQT